MDKHQAAQVLYNEGINQIQIASVMKVSEVTVGNWKKKYGWEKKRIDHALSKETAEDSLMELINYQLETLKRKKDKWLENPDDLKLIDKGDIDALSKMFSAVKGKQLEWTNYVRICREILDHIQSEDLAIAKEVTPILNLFLANKRKEL